MKKSTSFLMGMAALLLSFGLMLAGCDNLANTDDPGGPSVTITGTAKVGKKLTATAAGFSGTPKIEWQIADSKTADENEWRNINNEGSEYTITDENEGKYIRAFVRNEADNGNEVYSAVVGPILSATASNLPDSLTAAEAKELFTEIYATLSEEEKAFFALAFAMIEDKAVLGDIMGSITLEDPTSDFSTFDPSKQKSAFWEVIAKHWDVIKKALEEENPGNDTTPLTWTPVEDVTDTFTAITYANGKFVAAGWDKTAYSTDGETWDITENNIDTPFPIKSIAYGNGKFVAALRDSNMVVHFAEKEPQVMVWVDDIFKGFDRINDITYGDDKFVIAGDSGKMAYSTDGETWTEVTETTFDDTDIECITYANGKFVAIASDKAAYSTDGITWEAGTMPISASYITYGGGKFVASSSNSVSYSADGKTWDYDGYSIFESSYYGVLGIAYGGGKFVAVGYDGWSRYSGGVAYSTDGETWTEVKDDDNFYRFCIEGIAYGDGKFVAVGSNYSSGSTIMYSNKQE